MRHTRDTRKLKNMSTRVLIDLVRTHPQMGDGSGHPVETHWSDMAIIDTARAHPDRTVGRFINELQSWSPIHSTI